jgi:uncharacterized repeat protein (TIGR01451 family)
VNPIIPFGPFVFEGVLGGNDTLPGAGETFVLDVNVEGRFDDLVISRNGVDFDPLNPSNRSLDVEDDRVGSQQIEWDGLDNASNPFPVGSYTATIRLRYGEAHFVWVDVENSQAGGPTYELTNPPTGCPPLAGGCFNGFYDDRGYTTIGGTDVGTPGAVLPCPAGNPGCNPPAVPASDPMLGFDTRTDQRAFGDGTVAGFGDKKGLDLWTYYPAEANTSIDILQQPVLRISKDHDIPCYEPGEGQVVNYTIHYANEGTGPALGATVTDTLPEATTFVWCSGAACNETSPGSGVVVYSLGTVDAGAGGSLGLTVRVDDGAKGDLTNRARLAAANVPAVETPNVLPCCPSPGPTPTPWATWTPWPSWTPIPPLPVVLLPETGDGPASGPVCWLWLPLLLLGLPAAWVIRYRRG